MRIPDQPLESAPFLREPRPDQRRCQPTPVGPVDPEFAAQMQANRNRADLHLTSFAAVFCIIFAVMLLTVDNGSHELAYDNVMFKGTCIPSDQELQREDDSDYPPDIDIPSAFVWRGEMKVHVEPENPNVQPFDAIAYHTAIGTYTSDKDGEMRWLQEHPPGEPTSCYYGVVDGRIAVVFSLRAAFVPDWGSSWALWMTRIIFAAGAIFFSILTLQKYAAARAAGYPAAAAAAAAGGAPADAPTSAPADSETDSLLPPAAAAAAAGGRGGGGEVRPLVVDLQAPPPARAGHGSARSAGSGPDDMIEVPLSARRPARR